MKKINISLFLSGVALFLLVEVSVYADCRGCCSEHGGVVCIEGITKCVDGTPLSATCIEKGCNKCEANSNVPPPIAPIHDIQGSGSSSPLIGSSVTIEGVVVGDFQETDTELSGFYVQEEDADVDSDPATSEGIFVYTYTNNFGVNVGDLVQVSGKVSEYYGLTELTYVSNVQVLGQADIPSATTVNLPVSNIADWERYEGMLITMPQTLYVTGNYFLGRYGEVDLSIGDRLYNPTGLVSPGQPANDLRDINERSRILLDDGSKIQNPPIVPYIGAGNTLREGDITSDLTGILSYGYDHYHIHPTEPVNFTHVNTRDSSPPPVGGRLKIVSFNVLNYFNGDGLSGGFPTSRGADTLNEFNRQRDKIISAIIAMDPDIIGLMELENDGYGVNSAIHDLVNGLNDATSIGTYNFIDPGLPKIGADEIAVGIIYKPGKVAPVGSAAILDSSIDPSFNDSKNRPSLAQTFRENVTNEIFTAVVNHLKSKGTDCDNVGDPDTGDGQGNCNLTRTNAATALVNWLSTDPTGSNDPDILIIGDLNAYAMEDPITAVKNGGYTNLIESFIGTDAYSYIYDGESGYLEHALANESMTKQVTGVAQWHINADEPTILDYNQEDNPPNLYNPDFYRSSDHDPVLIGLKLMPPRPGLTGQLTTSVTGQTTSVVGATITVVETGQTATSDADGNYTLINVPIGTYRIKIEKDNFNTMFLDNIAISEGLITKLPTIKLTFIICKGGLPGDINGDGKIGLEEAIHALRVTSGVTTPTGSGN